MVTAQVEDAGAVQVVQDALRETVTGGSAVALSNFSVPLAGKTGTAQFGDGSTTHAWFMAYGPFEDPEIAVAVIIEGGGEGHAAALPVARDILQAYFSE
jgi:cell division protein FtsI/penicillin-binding protein 2